MSRQNRSGGGASARPADTAGGAPVRRAVVLPPAGDDAERAVLQPAPRSGTAATAEGTAGAGETGRGETEDLAAATAESGTASAADGPEARGEGEAEPGTDRGERTEPAAGTASSGGTAGSLSGLAAAPGDARRSVGAGRGSGDGDGDGAPGRPKAPVLAAAGIAGVVLLAVPLLIMVGNDRDERPDDHATAAADSRALLDGQEAQQPPGVYAAESPKTGAPAGSSKDEAGNGEKGERKGEKDDGEASPDGSGPDHGSAPDSVAEGSPQAGSRSEKKKEDTVKAPVQRAERKADETAAVAAARIVSADTGKCLTASSRGAGAELVIQPCGASEGAQVWSFHDTDTTLRIGGDLCMGLDGGSVEKGTAIRLQRCDGSSGQKFKINGTEDLVSLKAGDQCVDVWWGEEADGTPVKLWPCSGTANQTWRRG